MRVKPRKQRFQNYIPFESVIFLGREIQYETLCPVDLDMFLSIITMMMMIITVHLRATSLQRSFFFFGGVGVGGGGDGQSPRSLLFNGHFLLSQSGRCKVVQLYQYNLLYDIMKSINANEHLFSNKVSCR